MFNTERKRERKMKKKLKHPTFAPPAPPKPPPNDTLPSTPTVPRDSTLSGRKPCQTPSPKPQHTDKAKTVSLSVERRGDLVRQDACEVDGHFAPNSVIKADVHRTAVSGDETKCNMDIVSTNGDNFLSVNSVDKPPNGNSSLPGNRSVSVKDDNALPDALPVSSNRPKSEPIAKPLPPKCGEKRAKRKQKSQSSFACCCGLRINESPIRDIPDHPVKRNLRSGDNNDNLTIGIEDLTEMPPLRPNSLPPGVIPMQPLPNKDTKPVTNQPIGLTVTNLNPTFTKPVIQDVIIVKEDLKSPNSRTPQLVKRKSGYRRTKSIEELDKMVLTLELPLEFVRNHNFRSSFVGTDKTDSATDIKDYERAILNTDNVGDFQTLLKHSKNDKEHVYALPQPACYSESTLKAVKRITDKYDTLERWKQRAMSFRESTLHKQDSVTSHTTNSLPSPRSAPNEVMATTISETDIFQFPQITVTPVEYPTIELHDPLAHLHKAIPKNKLELFYKGKDTDVFVCSCLADVAFAETSLLEEPDVTWSDQVTGVPLWILNKGGGNRRRTLYLALADNITAFPIWQDRINYLSNYKDVNDTTHTVRLSSSLRKVAEIRMHDAESARTFYERFVDMTRDPNDDLWKVSEATSKGKLKQKTKSSKKRKKKPTKGDISVPCNFQHVSKLNSNMADMIASMAESRGRLSTMSSTSDMRPQSQVVTPTIEDIKVFDDNTLK